MKFFLEVGPREGNPASHTPQVVVGSGWSMRMRWLKNGFLIIGNGVEGLEIIERKRFLAAPGTIK